MLILVMVSRFASCHTIDQVNFFSYLLNVYDGVHGHVFSESFCIPCSWFLEGITGKKCLIKEVTQNALNSFLLLSNTIWSLSFPFPFASKIIIQLFDSVVFDFKFEVYFCRFSKNNVECGLH
jgi:hypothetical protein